MEAYLFQILEGIVFLAVTLAATMIANWLRHRISHETWQRKIELAQIAVAFVQQAYRHLDGPQKYEQAAIWIEERFHGLGIRATNDEIRALIESALRRFKDEFGENWGKGDSET